MSTWTRWRIALPLLGLSLLLLAPALLGAWAWWSEYGVAYQVLSVLICLVMAAAVGVSISIGVRPARDVPWIRIGLVVLAFLLTCAMAALRESV